VRAVGAEETVSLTLGDQQAVVHARGGRVETYRVGGAEVLAGAENPGLFAFRGALLAPWPNRVAGARWRWQGRELELPVNDPGSGSALHGLVFDVEWSVEQIDATRVLLSYALAAQPGYPFPLHLTVSYALDRGGLRCALRAVNAGAAPAPVGLGVHPYLAVQGLVDDVVLTLPATTLLETDSAWRETGRREAAGTDLDFSSGRRLGDAALDDAFTDVRADGDGCSRAGVELPDGRVVTVWAGATCRWWQVYTADTLLPADRRRSVAVEPMTCPPDALNSGEIDVIAPDEALQLDWGFQLR
jgi:aldose 1-epimerase